MAAVDYGGSSPPAYPVAEDYSIGLPPALSRCQQVVAVTVRLPEFLLAAAGLMQRLDAAGVSISLLELAVLDTRAERAARSALSSLALVRLDRSRLGLPASFGLECADVVVAAISELIGFDPEPGVCCLVPAVGDGSQPSHQAVAEAAKVIANAYRRVQLIRFSVGPSARTAEIVLEPREWQRKCDALTACATAVTPLCGGREFIGA
ncbi:MAG: hypothetical protein JO100_08030 [Pseudonocardia sp.]|nr:hypothetical protein [Pseudonocardia sp.]